MFRALTSAGLDAVLYKEVSDPTGVGLLVMSEDAETLTGDLHELFRNRPFSALVRKPDHARLGVTYAPADDGDSLQAMADRRRERLLNPAWP